jgi:hypothetical protein
MDALVQNIHDYASVPQQALAVTVGGLIGVFVTLAVFFVFIFAADRLAMKKKAE